MWGAIVDAIKHGHDQTIGRGLDMWQTNYMDRKIQNRTAELNRQLWEHQMSNAYQLTVEDMRKAGINPMVAFSNGATSVGGHASSASGYNGQKNSSWMPSQSLMNAKSLKVMDSQIGKTNEEKNLISAQLESAKAQASIDKAVAKVWAKNPWVARAQVANTVSPKTFSQAMSMLGGFGVLQANSASDEKVRQEKVAKRLQEIRDEQRQFSRVYRDSY